MTCAHIAFITVGQSPRVDLVPELVSFLKTEITYREFGALNGLTNAELAEMAPADPGEHSLCTRLADGREIVTSQNRTTDKIRSILSGFQQGDFDLVVLLCSGPFEPFDCACPILDANTVTEKFADAAHLCGLGVGIITPLQEGMEEYTARPEYAARDIAFASPYSNGDMSDAGARVAHADVIIMHCLGYTDTMRKLAEKGSFKAVVTARRLVAESIEHIISGEPDTSAPSAERQQTLVGQHTQLW